MAKPNQTTIQEALQKLLTSPKVIRQIASHRKTQDPPQALSKVVKDGNIEDLCEYLRQNPAFGIPDPICELMQRLHFLSRAIGIDWDISWPDSEVIFHGEWLDVEKDERVFLPDGTSDAADQALVDLVQAWVEGFLPNHKVQKIPPKPKGKQAKKRGPKVKVDSWSQYGDYEDRGNVFEEMKTYLENSWPKTQLKKGKTEDSQHFETRAIEIVQAMHAEFGSISRYWSSGYLGGPGQTITPLPQENARTIAQQAMTKTQKSINSRHLICGLLALYERNDPTQFLAIRQLVSRKV